MLEVTTEMALIHGASRTHQIIEFIYKNKKGEKSVKKVEVYECKDNHFFGFDLAENKIKTFLYNSVDSITIGDKFIPRF